MHKPHVTKKNIFFPVHLKQEIYQHMWRIFHKRIFLQNPPCIPLFLLNFHQNTLAWLASKNLEIDKNSRIAIDTEDRNIKYFLQRYLPDKTDLTDVSRDILLMRAVKSQNELRNFSVACRTLDASFNSIYDDIPRLNKFNEESLMKAIRQKIFEQLERFGRDYEDERMYPDQSPYSYSNISSGQYTADIHHKSSPNKTVDFEKEIIFLNLHVCYDGYEAEFERTLMPEKIRSEVQKNIDILDEMNRTAMRNLMPGTEPYTVDEKVREVMYRHGLTNNWKCGGGHGMGLDYYEYPNWGKRIFVVNRGYELRESMVTTIEPRLDFENYGLMNSTLFILTPNGP